MARAILRTNPETCFRLSEWQRCNTGEDSHVSGESTDCQKSPLVYFLVVRDTHGSPDQRGLRPKGGRANRRRCAR